MQLSRKLRWLGNAVAVSNCGLGLAAQHPLHNIVHLLASCRVRLAGVGRHGQELRSVNGRPETRPRLQNASLHVRSHSQIAAWNTATCANTRDCLLLLVSYYDRYNVPWNAPGVGVIECSKLYKLI